MNYYDPFLAAGYFGTEGQELAEATDFPGEADWGT
jgi:hypothetical protein